MNAQELHSEFSELLTDTSPFPSGFIRFVKDRIEEFDNREIKPDGSAIMTISGINKGFYLSEVSEETEKYMKYKYPIISRLLWIKL